MTVGVGRATGAPWRRRGQGFDNEFGGELNYDEPSRPASVGVLHAEEIVISSRGKRVTVDERAQRTLDRPRPQAPDKEG